MVKALLQTSFIAGFLFAAPASQAQVSPSTINGTVYNDVNGNGVQDSGEPGIPGVLVELRGGTTTNDLQTAVISGANGSYSLSSSTYPTAANYRLRYFFPTDAYSVTAPSGTSFNSGSTRTQPFSLVAATPSNLTADMGLKQKDDARAYSTMYGLAATNWAGVLLSLPQTKTGVGRLSSVKLYINYHVTNPSVTIRNTAGTEPVTGRYTTSADFVLTVPFANEVYSYTTSNNSPNIPPLSPGADLTLTNLNSTSGSNEYLYEDFISEFIGDATFSVPFSSEGFSGFTGSGNFEASVTTQSGVGLFVIYEYEPGSLPVRLSNISVAAEGESAVVKWSTSKEVNSNRFEVEKSLNGREWSKIGTVSARGESSATLNYNFPDNNPALGLNYYRLRMVDFDGSFEFSPIVSTNIRLGQQNSVSIFPNPVADALFIKNIESREVVELAVLSQAGSQLLVKNSYDPSKGVDIRSLEAGLYMIRYTLKSGEQKTLKFLVNN